MGDPIKFVQVHSVVEDGRTVLYGVDKVGKLWRGEVAAPGTEPRWHEVVRPAAPPRRDFRD